MLSQTSARVALGREALDAGGELPVTSLAMLRRASLAPAISAVLSHERLTASITVRDREACVAADQNREAVGLFEFLESSGFDLPDPLASDAHEGADLFECHALGVTGDGSHRVDVLRPFEVRPGVEGILEKSHCRLSRFRQHERGDAHRTRDVSAKRSCGIDTTAAVVNGCQEDRCQG